MHCMLWLPWYEESSMYDMCSRSGISGVYVCACADAGYLPVCLCFEEDVETRWLNRFKFRSGRVPTT